MSLIRRVVVAALGTALIGAVPALAQSNRALVIGIFGGGYTHVNNLNGISGQNADFRPGYNVGTAISPSPAARRAAWRRSPGPTWTACSTGCTPKSPIR